MRASPCFMIPMNRILDLSFFQTDWNFMIVPYAESDAKLSKKKESFNKKVRAGRSAIECAFGVWKAQFPVLEQGITAKNPKNAGILIMCLGALHNFILLHTTKDEKKLAVNVLSLEYF